MKPIPEDQLGGLKYTSIFGFENLAEASSHNDGETRVRIFAMHKDSGIPHNYLVRISAADISDQKLMAKLKSAIKDSFVGVIEGEPK